MVVQAEIVCCVITRDMANKRLQLLKTDNVARENADMVARLIRWVWICVERISCISTYIARKKDSNYGDITLTSTRLQLYFD